MNTVVIDYYLLFMLCSGKLWKKHYKFYFIFTIILCVKFAAKGCLPIIQTGEQVLAGLPLIILFTFLCMHQRGSLETMPVSWQLNVKQLQRQKASKTAASLAPDKEGNIQNEVTV